MFREEQRDKSGSFCEFLEFSNSLNREEYGKFPEFPQPGHDCRRFASASDDKTLRLWELPSGKAIGQPLIGHTDAASCLAISSAPQLTASVKCSELQI